MKSRKELRPWADRLAGKHEFEAVVLGTWTGLDSDRFDFIHPAVNISERIHDRREIERLIQSEKIADALNNARTQMLVRDYHRPEFFIWSLELKEDDLRFGFSRQSVQNKFKKHIVNLSFERASDRFYGYFDAKLRVSSINVSALSKREE